MIAQHAPVARWGTQLAAWLAALVLHLWLRSRTPVSERMATVLAALAFLAIASTLLAPGIDGVHRWHRVGPIQLHPSALLCPALLVLAAPGLRGSSLRTQLGLVLVQLVHLAQPDAGQATALAAGAVALLLAQEVRPAAIALALVQVAVAALAWLRPDPPGPMPFVEDIVVLAFTLGAPVGMLAIAALAALVASPFLRRGQASTGDPMRHASRALAAYLGASTVVHLFGEFPVPALGFGASPVLGAFLGLTALQRLRRGRATDGGENPAGERGDQRAAGCGKPTPP
ncbi:MAG: FtsW/RodA/SpoVE family cell cycle protein [Polyangiaceae bacterium]